MMESQSFESRKNGKMAGVDFLEFLSTIWKSRMLIAANVVIVTLLATFVSLVLPKWYKATATILPPKDAGLLNIFNGAGTSSLLRGLSTLSRIGSIGQSSGPYNYFAILKSRLAMQQVVTRFDLINVYDISDHSLEKAIKELQENVAFDITEDDYFTIEVMDKDPVRAADMANYFVQVLNSMSIELGTREARTNREFIERRLQDARDTLEAAENRLKTMQQKTGILITPEQTASASALAQLYAEKTRKEIEVAIAEKSATPDNPALQELRSEVNEFNRKLGTFPEAGLDILRLYRDVVTQEKILEFLTPLNTSA